MIRPRVDERRWCPLGQLAGEGLAKVVCFSAVCGVVRADFFGTWLPKGYGEGVVFLGRARRVSGEDGILLGVGNMGLFRLCNSVQVSFLPHSNGGTEHATSLQRCAREDKDGEVTLGDRIVVPLLSVWSAA